MTVQIFNSDLLNNDDIEYQVTLVEEFYKLVDHLKK